MYLNECFNWPSKKPRLHVNDWEFLAEIYPNLNKKTPDLYLSEGIVGIEIEVENYFDVDESDKYLGMMWAKANDGSLRNRGKEFISCPLFGTHIFLALNLLDQHFQKLRNKIVFSDLCGVHVHLNIRDFTAEQFANLIFLYTLFENSLIRFSGNRGRNIFCLPISILQPALRQVFVSAAINEERLMHDITELIYNINEDRAKYSAFNYVPVSSLGTVEFRHMEGNFDIPRLCRWISFILLLRDSAQTIKFADLKEKVFLLNTNSQYEEFGKDIFQDWFNYLNCSTTWNEMSEGVKTLKALSIPTESIYVDDVERRKSTNNIELKKIAFNNMVVDDFNVDPPIGFRNINLGVEGEHNFPIFARPPDHRFARVGVQMQAPREMIGPIREEVPDDDPHEEEEEI